MAITCPTKYKAAYARQARALCASGLTDRELAAEFGVSRSTIFRWRAANPDFAEATALGKSVANERVARALYERAIGYEEEAVRVYMPTGATAPVIVRYAREVRPDVHAALQWLRAREPEIWMRVPSSDDDQRASFGDQLRKAMIRLANKPPPHVRE